MKNFYVDSSSLLKRYIEEAGSEEVQGIFQETPRIFVSWLTYSECVATFGRLHRTNFIRSEEYEYLVDSFVNDWQGFEVNRETEQLEPIITSLVTRFGLRGADAVQLACAVFLMERDIHLKFVCSDRSLANVAKDAKLKVMTPGL